MIVRFGAGKSTTIIKSVTVCWARQEVLMPFKSILFVECSIKLACVQMKNNCIVKVCCFGFFLPFWLFCEKRIKTSIQVLIKLYLIIIPFRAKCSTVIDMLFGNTRGRLEISLRGTCRLRKFVFGLSLASHDSETTIKSSSHLCTFRFATSSSFYL